MARWRKWAAGALAGLALLAAAAAAVYFGGLIDTSKRPDPRRLAMGQQVYAAYCAACHGADLEGQADWRVRGPDGLLPAPPHDESGHTWHHPDQQLLEIIELGTAALVGGDYKTTMTGFADRLSDDEIAAALDYIKSRWPEEIRRRQAEATARAGQAQ